MNWLATSLGVALAVALAVQGFICVIQKGRLTKVGALSLLLAVVSLFFCFALQSGSVVISTEFGIVLVMGTYTTFLLGAAMVALSICAGLLLLSTRPALKQQQNWKFAALVWSLSVLVGVGSCLHFAVVGTNAHFTGPLAVRFYGMWFPPFLLWLLFCFSQSVLALLEHTGRLAQFLLASLLITPVGLYGLGWQEISDPLTSDPFSRLLWQLIVCVAFSSAVGLSIWKVLRPGLIRWTAALISFTLTAATLGHAYRDGSVDSYREPVLIAFVLLAAVQALAAIRSAIRKERATRVAYIASSADIAALAYNYWEVRGRPEGSSDQDWSRAEKELRTRGPKDRWEPYFLSFLLCFLAVCLFDLLYFSAGSARIDLLLAFIAWFLLAEFISHGAVSRLPGWTVDLSRSAVVSFKPVFRRAKDSIAVQSSPSPAEKNDKPAESSWGKTLRIALQAVTAVVLLVAISEAMHYGNTVIDPFANPDADANKERPGDQLAKLLVDELNQMRRDIPELVVVSSAAGASRNPTGPERGRTTSNLTVASEGTSLASAIPGSNELDLFGLKVPLGSLAVLVQAPVRYVFRIEQITGSIYKETVGQETKWRAIAFSNQGKVWASELVRVSKEMEITKSDKRPSDNQEECDAEDGTARSPIQTLARELAFRIAIDQPDSGMTQSWGAFENFERGINRLKQFDSTNKTGDLRTAIACFQSATVIDKGFADGYYQLAVSLEKYGQPIRAAEAMRAALNVNPDNLKVLVRRANTIYNFRTFYDTPPVLAPPVPWSAPSQEATQMWYRIAEREPGATLLELRSAYLGICQSLSDEELQGLSGAYDDATPKNPALAVASVHDRAVQLAYVADKALRSIPRTNFYLPYYFCKRAEALYATVPESDRNDPDVRKMEAAVLNQLGNTIGLHNQKVLPPQDLDATLFCDAEAAIDFSYVHSEEPPLLSWSSPVARQALPYYEASRRLAPQDTSIACNYASVALYSTGDEGPMRALHQDSTQLIVIGDTLERVAHEYAYGIRTDSLFGDANRDDQTRRSSELAAFYYQIALKNYDAAVAVDPTLPGARDSLGYCIWSWALDARLRGFRGPTQEQLDGAVERVSKARQYLSLNDPRALMNLETTLAELYIAKGQPEVALKKLGDLKDNVEKANSLDDMETSVYLFLDTAHAYACASRIDARNAADYRKKASEALDRLRKTEERSEFRPLSGKLDLSELLTKGNVCFDPPKKSRAGP